MFVWLTLSRLDVSWGIVQQASSHSTRRSSGTSELPIRPSASRGLVADDVFCLYGDVMLNSHSCQDDSNSSSSGNNNRQRRVYIGGSFAPEPKNFYANKTKRSAWCWDSATYELLDAAEVRRIFPYTGSQDIQRYRLVRHTGNQDTNIMLCAHFHFLLHYQRYIHKRDMHTPCRDNKSLYHNVRWLRFLGSYMPLAKINKANC